MINSTMSTTNTPPTSPQNVHALAITFGVAIGGLSIISLIIITSFLCFRKPAPPRHAGSYSSDEDRDSIDIEMGLDEATLNTYPKILYSQVKLENENPETIASTCSICLQEYKDSDIVRLLPDCDHFFHVPCIDPWLKLHHTCPVCRNSPVQSPIRNRPPETANHQRLSYDTWFVQIMR